MFQHYLWVNHHDTKGMLACCQCRDWGCCHPSQVIEHLVAARQFLTLPPAVQSQFRFLRQSLQFFGNGKISGSIFLKRIKESLTGIHNLHRLVVYLNTDAQTSGWIHILGWKNAEGYGERLLVLCQFEVVFQRSSLSVCLAFAITLLLPMHPLPRPKSGRNIHFACLPSLMRAY